MIRVAALCLFSHGWFQLNEWSQPDQQKSTYWHTTHLSLQLSSACSFCFHHLVVPTCKKATCPEIRARCKCNRPHQCTLQICSSNLCRFLDLSPGVQLIISRATFVLVFWPFLGSWILATFISLSTGSIAEFAQHSNFESPTPWNGHPHS